ncbi:MAG: DNA gyrase inhibitor YacG [Gammaproteobacteria bacterium]
MPAQLTVMCPHCNKPVPWTESHKFKPFCSERCKLIDLGEWVTEDKKIPGDPATEEDFQDTPFPH